MGSSGFPGGRPGEDVLAEARKRILCGKASCVVIRGKRIAWTASGHGVAPLLTLYERSPELLKDAWVVDKVIGKAAAMLLVLAGAAGAYGVLMSDAALLYLKSHGLRADSGRRVSRILNRTGDGVCPMERAVADTEDPEEGYRLLKKAVGQLRKSARP